MARRVRVSTLGVPRRTPPPNLEGQALVEDMIHFLQGEIRQVLPDRPDLIVLPECCDLYRMQTYAQKAEFALVRGDQVRDCLGDIARRNRCYITYPSIRRLDDGSWRNSVTLLDRAGESMGAYDKNHVVIEEATEAGVLCGTEAPLFQCDFGSVAVAICFDLNFEELRLQYQTSRPDIILFPSMYHGGLMQAYWAYSCRSHFVGCISDPGCPSSILSPVGHEIASTTEAHDHVTATVNLDCRLAHMDGNESKLSAAKEKYGPAVTIFDPGRLGPVLLTSESNETPVDDIIAEFEIELLDDYLERSRKLRLDPYNGARA